MNKKLITLCVSVLLSMTVSSQSNKFNIGITGGASLVSMRGDYLFEDEYKSLLSYSFGASFEYNFSKHFSLNSNFLFERKGEISIEKYEFGNNGQTIGEDYEQTNLDYLTLPLLAKYRFGDNIIFFLNAGPYVGYLLKGEYTTPNNLDLGGDLTNEMTRYDFGVSMGGGVTFPLKKSLALTLELRHNIGFANVNEGILGYTEYNTVSSNLFFGLTYQLGK